MKQTNDLRSMTLGACRWPPTKGIVPDKLRVVFLTPSLHVGGAERWILSLARNFLNVEPAGVVLCAPHYHPDMLEQAARLMPVYVAKRYGDPGETRRLLERACITADALIAWGVPRLAAVSRGLVGRSRTPSGRSTTSSHREGRRTTLSYEHIPVIDVSHSDGRWEQQTKMVRRAADGADYHVAVSRCALSAFPDEVRERAIVIYNGAEVDRVAPRRILPLPLGEGRGEGGRHTKNSVSFGANDLEHDSPHPHPLPAGEGMKKVALFLGRFEHVKGFDRLVEAAEHLPDDWTIVAHGHGSLSSKFCNLHSAIHICPPLAHVGDALARANVLVMPSRFEGMPLALVEAWLAGTATVTTPFGFVREAEQMHRRLGEVVSQNPTGKELADGIVRAAEGKFVQRARQVAWRHYTAAAMAQRWEEFLYAAMNAPHYHGGTEYSARLT